MEEFCFAGWGIRRRTSAAEREEGKIREALAARFLNAEPEGRRGEADRRRMGDAVRELAEVEIRSLLRPSNRSRPLRRGNLTGLLDSTLSALAQLARRKGTCVTGAVPRGAVCTAAEPRVLQITVARLVRACLSADPRQPVRVRVTVRERSVIVSVSADRLKLDPSARALLREAARLHRGNALASGGTVAFSIRRELPHAVGPFFVPTAEELIGNPVSAVHVGFAGDGPS